MSITPINGTSHTIDGFLDVLENANTSPLHVLTMLSKLCLLNNHDSSKLIKQDLVLKKLLATELRGNILENSLYFYKDSWCPTLKFAELGAQTIGVAGSAYGILYPLFTDAKTPKEIQNVLTRAQLAGSLTSPISQFFQTGREAAKTDMQATQQSHNSSLEAERQDSSAREQREREILQQIQGLNDKDGQVFGELARG